MVSHFSSAAPTGTADLHAIGKLLNDLAIAALMRHVGSVLIVRSGVRHEEAKLKGQGSGLVDLRARGQRWCT